MTPLLCLSHLRWDFVFQRPQHLMTRFAERGPVYYVEEPFFDEGPPRLETSARARGLRVIVPRLPRSLAANAGATASAMRMLLGELVASMGSDAPIVWYYTPAALRFSSGVEAALRVYDCMDELSSFAGADPELVSLEGDLLRCADLVFTGGASLFEAKRGRHPAIYLFPSSIDRAHFAQARAALPDPADQRGLGRPRLGYCGVIDERMDLELVDELARAEPDWQLVFVGPVAKIDPARLPRRPNIAYLGQKTYDELPAYLSGWDVALLPFARNEATRFISPTKIPEYLAAGLGVVSTPIVDVVHAYAPSGLVELAEDASSFAAASRRAMSRRADTAWNQSVERFLTASSWDDTWRQMAGIMDRTMLSRRRAMRC